MFVACNRVVKSINENEIIKPYLMEIPDKYHQFFELFEVLGMDRQVNVCNFVRVLALDEPIRHTPSFSSLATYGIPMSFPIFSSKSALSE
jgi:hypothetical protein